MTPAEKFNAVVNSFILTYLVPVMVILALGFVIYVGVTQYIKHR